MAICVGLCAGMAWDAFEVYAFKKEQKIKEKDDNIE